MSRPRPDEVELSRTRTRRCVRCNRRKIIDKFPPLEEVMTKQSEICIECLESEFVKTSEERTLRGRSLRMYPVPIIQTERPRSVSHALELGYIGYDGEVYDTPDWQPPEEPKGPTPHAFRMCPPGCTHTRLNTCCPYNTGIIKDCVMCGLMDSELTTECSGTLVSELMAYFAFEGSVDFVNSRWTMGNIGRRNASGVRVAE